MALFIKSTFHFSVVLMLFPFVEGNSGGMMEKLIQRIEALETAGNHQQAVNNEQQHQLHTQAKQLVAQENRIKRLEEELSKENGVHDVHGRSRRLLLGDGGEVVAFHAVLDAGDHEHYGIGQKVVFPIVHLNKGSSYHPAHGLFIAPRSGMYLFSTSVISGEELHVALWKNSTQLAGVYSMAGYVQGSTSVVTELVVGDEVYVSVRRPADAHVWGEYLSSFMGYLLLEY